MKRQIINLSVWPAIMLILLSMCAAQLSSSALAEPLPPTPSPKQLYYEGLEQTPLLAPAAPLAEPLKVAAVDQPPVWSKIVFQSYRKDNWEIYLANGDGSNQVRLTHDEAADITPRLNRGCTRIAFASRRTGNYEIFTMNLGGSELMQLTNNNQDDVNPAWSPDGTRIAFQSYRDGQAEIYVMNANGSGQTRLTSNSGYDGSPNWSPDGSRIAFASYRNNQYRIWVMNADGSNQRQISDQPYSADPAWSPDGSRIAYDADSNGDGWQEIWLMNADGSNQRQVYDPPEANTDAWVRSWSPDGRYVAFTRISFIYYQGSWYWTAAYLDAWDSANPASAVRLSNLGLDWYPDWQTSDTLAPTSSVQALPAQSPGPVTVSWSGADVGPAGLRDYDVQVRDGPGGVWSDWQQGTIATSASYPGLGGHTYYFRSRARDNAYNLEPWPVGHDAMTTVEALPPRSAVDPLPPYCRRGCLISWSGSDPGGSGIKSYDVQYRDTTEDGWSDWQIGTADTADKFYGTAGHTYDFRARATDKAQNVEAWPAGAGDTSTTLYTWAVTGTIRNNRGAPVAGASVTTVPEAFLSAPSTADGAYAAYVAAFDLLMYTVNWVKPGYGALPPTSFPAVEDAGDARVDVVLPPPDNVVQDWGFESGNLEAGGWLTSGVVAPEATDAIKHTGVYAALLGQHRVFGPAVNLGKGRSAKLALDSTGTVHVVFGGRKEGSEKDIYYARRETDGVWSTPHNISNNPGDSTWPQLAVDNTGVVHVVWEDESRGIRKIYYARRGSDGSWSSPQVIPSSYVYPNSSRLAVDKDGNAHVVWTEEGWIDSSTTSFIYYTQQGNDGTWSSVQNLSSNLWYSEYPRLALDGYGNTHVVWSGSLGDWEHHLYYRQRASDGIWSEPKNISEAAYDLSAQMAVDESGTVHVLWDDNSPQCDGLCYRQRAADGTWSPMRVIPYYPGGGTYDLVARGEAAHLVWRQWPLEIYYMRCGNDGKCTAPQIVSRTPYLSESPKLAVDGNETVHIVWQQGSPDGADIYYTRKGGIWSTPQNASQTAGESLFPELVVSEKGAAHLVWADYEDVKVYYAEAALAEQASDSNIAQTVTLPITMSAPTLSFLYQLFSTTAARSPWFDVQVSNGIIATTLFSTTTSTTDWTHRWFDLTPWAGQSVTLTFNVHQTAGGPATWAYLDEVTLGSGTYPDLWVSQPSRVALPGEQVSHTIAYGNQGDSMARATQITMTLPPELAFVTADPPPTATGPALVWDVGDLLAGSGPFTIVVTTVVSPTVPLGSVLNGSVNIASSSLEVEMGNNQTPVMVFVGGQQRYLPVIVKG